MPQTVTILRDCFSKSREKKPDWCLGSPTWPPPTWQPKAWPMTYRRWNWSATFVNYVQPGALRLQKLVFWSATWMFWIYCNHSKSIILSTSLLTQPMSADDCSFQISVVIVTVNDCFESTIKKFTKNPKVCTKNHRKRPLDGRERAVWNHVNYDCRIWLYLH